MDQLSDFELLNLYMSKRDDDTLARLVQRHASLVFGTCFRVLRNRHDAEDAFQATFLILVRRPPVLHPGASLAAWLYRVAHRTAVRAAKRRRDWIDIEFAEVSAAANGPFEEIQKREILCVLDEELVRLPERYRGPLVLCYLQGKSREEAACDLGCTKASVKARLARGRQLLRSRLLRRRVFPALVTVVVAQSLTKQGYSMNSLIEKCVQVCGSSPATAGIPEDVSSLAKTGVGNMVSSVGLKAAAALCVVAVVFVSIIPAVQSSDGRSGQSPGSSINISTAESDADEADRRQDLALQFGFGEDDSSTAQEVTRSDIPQDVFIGGEYGEDGMEEAVRRKDGLVRDGTPLALRGLRLKSKYQKAQARALRMKAQAKMLEGEAASAAAAKRQSMLVESRRLFASGEAAELTAKADLLEGQAKLFDDRAEGSANDDSLDEFSQLPNMSIVSPTVRGPGDVFRAGDTVRFEVFPPDPNWGKQRVTVSEQGTIRLPHIGRVRAVGSTLTELGRDVWQKYKEWKRESN